MRSHKFRIISIERPLVDVIGVDQHSINAVFQERQVARILSVITNIECVVVHTYRSSSSKSPPI